MIFLADQWEKKHTVVWRDVPKVGADQLTGMWGKPLEAWPRAACIELQLDAELCSERSVLEPQTNYSWERLAFSYRRKLFILNSSSFSDVLELCSDSEVS